MSRLSTDPATLNPPLLPIARVGHPVSPSPPTTVPSATPLWHSPQAWILLAFVLVCYLPRLTTLTIRGEETRRALVAREMLATGDYVVPRVQGQPLLSRPPLQNWLIAGWSAATGRLDELAVRLPSVIAVAATSLLVFWYARGFLSPLGAFASGLVFASLGQVVELGRFGETDALFTLFVSWSLLGWHAGFRAGWPRWQTWCLGYLAAALGTLTKGPQAPVYFVTGVGLFLLCGRHWRMLFCRTHLAGLTLFLVLVGSWQIPFQTRVGTDAGRDIYLADVGHRFLDASWSSFAGHFALYPFELWACLLPWSALALVWNRPGFRLAVGPAWPTVRFLGLTIAAALPTVWLPPGSRPRYFMSLYPCIALLLGLTIDRLAAAAPDAEWRRIWPWFLRGCGLIMLAAGACVLVVSFWPIGSWYAQSAHFAGLYALISVLAATVVWRLAVATSPRAWTAALLTIAGFVGLTQVGVLVTAHQQTTPDTIARIAELRQMLPEGTRLHSLNLAHHMFVFHWGELPRIQWPQRAEEWPEDVEFFCFDVRELVGREIPGDWEEIFQVPCTKHRDQEYQMRVIVGRRRGLRPLEPAVQTH